MHEVAEERLWFSIWQVLRRGILNVSCPVLPPQMSEGSWRGRHLSRKGWLQKTFQQAMPCSCSCSLHVCGGRRIYHIPGFSELITAKVICRHRLIILCITNWESSFPMSLSVPETRGCTVALPGFGFLLLSVSLYGLGQTGCQRPW